MADAGRDTKLFPVCAPWSGDKGRGFTHVFAVEFPAGLARIKDHYSSLKQHLEGKDFGGISPPTPAQLAANPNHVNDPRPHPGAGGGAAAAVLEVAKSEEAFELRRDELLSLIRSHVINQGIKSAIDTMVAKHTNNAPDQPVLEVQAAPAAGGVPLYAAGHPNAGNALSPADLRSYQLYGNSLGRHAWGLLVTEGTYVTSGLRAEQLDDVWTGLLLSHVPFSERTIRDLAAYIDTTNVERGAAAKTDEQKRTKLLKLITYPTELASRATNELQYCSDQWRVGGVPSYSLTVTGMQELWEAHFPKCTKPTWWTERRPKGPMHRADQLALTATDANSVEFEHGADDELGAAAYAYAAEINQSGTGSSVAGEGFCWNCLGFGHTKSGGNGVPPCPSPRSGALVRESG